MKKLFVAAMAVVLTACGSPEVSNDHLMAVIQEREDAWSAAFNAGDADALGAIYTEDAVLIPPGSSPVWGRDEAVGVLSSLFGVLLDVQLTADHVRPIGGDYAVEVGHGTYDTMGEDGARVANRVNYIIVWHKGDDGVWRYTSDIFNAAPLGE